MNAWAASSRSDVGRGKPVENGYIESSTGRLRDECLNLELFWSVQEARAKLEK
jgi:hypothetical protein